MTGRIEKFVTGKFYLMVDPAVAKKLLAKGDRRVICHLNRYQFHCALLFSKEKGYYVYLDANWVRKNKPKTGTYIKATFKRDDTKYQFNVPEEWKEVLTKKLNVH